MRYSKFHEKPKNVRIYKAQEELLTELMQDQEYCMSKGIHSQSDLIRRELNNGLKDYELNKLGTKQWSVK
tara:strand:- start:295 stop:504 length:210 start_codon:yes stop_codon:yes gene_type:complete